MKNLKTLLSILILIVGAQLLYGQTVNDQDFKMVGKNHVTIGINQSLSGTTELSPFGGNVREIYGLDLTADITLNSDKSLVRVILVDQNYEEYLVYEIYPLLSANQVVSVREICEETGLLNAVKPKSLRVEIQDAVVTLYTINCAGSIDIGMDVLKVKKEKLLAQNGEKIKGNSSFATERRESKSRAAGWSCAGRPWCQHHGFLQGIQCPHVQSCWRSTPGRDQHFHRWFIHLYSEVAARRRAHPQGRRDRKGFCYAQPR